MNDIYQGKKEMANGAVRVDDIGHPEVDSQVLQEIIDILKHPFQMVCKACNGLGFVRDGHDCHACEGTGKVNDKALR